MLCGTKYNNLSQLNRHIEIAHTGKEGLLDLLRALAVDESSVSRTMTPPVTIPAAASMGQPNDREEVQHIDRTPETVTAFLKNNNDDGAVFYKKQKKKSSSNLTEWTEDDVILTQMTSPNHP